MASTELLCLSCQKNRHFKHKFQPQFIAIWHSCGCTIHNVVVKITDSQSGNFLPSTSQPSHSPSGEHKLVAVSYGQYTSKPVTDISKYQTYKPATHLRPSQAMGLFSITLDSKLSQRHNFASMMASLQFYMTKAIMTRSSPQWQSGHLISAHEMLNLWSPICKPSVLGTWGSRMGAFGGSPIGSY